MFIKIIYLLILIIYITNSIEAQIKCINYDPNWRCLLRGPGCTDTSCPSQKCCIDSYNEPHCS